MGNIITVLESITDLYFSSGGFKVVQFLAFGVQALLLFLPAMSLHNTAFLPFLNHGREHAEAYSAFCP